MNLHVNRSFSLKTIPVLVPRPPSPKTAHDPRAQLAAQFVPAGARVLDFSGAPLLKGLLPDACSYRAIDVFSGEFPTEAAAQSDAIVMLGTLERIADLDAFFTHLRFSKCDLIASYRARDLATDDAGGRLGFYELATLFDRYGYRIECTAPAGESGMLMRLTAGERLRPAEPCHVAVIAGGDFDGFGNRLGRAMLQSVLPGEAEIDWLTPGTLDRAADSYDLVVLGTGNGLLQPLFDERVLDVVGRGKAAVGIFGTHYRELIPRAAFDRLLDRLDTWFARYRDDVLIYGRGRSNVVHLGDWTFDLVPLGQADEAEPLRIAAAPPPEVALDRAIATFQRHRSVYSEQLHPLLCALTAADMAAYAERPSPALKGAAPGEFRSLLIDVFGRSYPEQDFFLVDREAVARYKAAVHRRVGELRACIESLVRNAAVAAA